MYKFNYKILSFLLFIFFTLQVIPFLTRQNMQQILIIDYSIVLPTIFVYSALKFDKYNPVKYLYYSGLTIMSFILFLYGFSGSISGFILTATVPYFIFIHINTPDKLYKILFPALKWASILIIIFGAIMFLSIRTQLNNMNLMTTFFIKASINYVSLLFYGFAILYMAVYDIKKQFLSTPSKFEFILGVAILISSVFYSAMYLTRSTFIATLVLLAIFFRENKTIMIISLVLVLFVYLDDVYYYILGLLGTDSVKDLATQDIRVMSINNLVNKSLDFDFDFSKNMSFSSLFNVIFCFFPFTLILGIQIITAIIHLVLLKNLKRMIFYGSLLSVALFICLYQMDFFSPFALFIICQMIIFEYNYLKNHSNIRIN